MANNSIKLDSNGILVVTESGYQTSESIRELNQQVIKQVQKLQSAGKPALILSDLTHITGHDKGSEAEAIRAMRIPFDAMAIYTASRADRMLINMLVVLNNARSRIRTFKTRQEAYAWSEEFK